MLLFLTWATGGGAILLVVAISIRRAGLSPGRTPGRHSKRRRWISTPPNAAHRRRRRIRIGTSVVVAGLVIAAGIEAVTLALAVGDLSHGGVELTDANAALGTNPAEWTTDRINSAQGLNSEARALVVKADLRLSRDPVIGALRHLPVVGEQLTAMVDLSNSAAEGSAAFDDALAIAQAVNQSRTSADPPGTRLLRLISQATGPWADADSRLSPVLDRLRQDIAHNLLPPLASRAQRAVTILQPVDDLAKVGTVAARFGPTALGATSPQNYLVLLSNPSELRPAGGFNGSIGWVTVDKGAPVSVEVKPQEYFNPLISRRTDPPYPMGRYLTFFHNSLEIGDAGWDPDFPTTAKLSESLYSAATKRQPDNTVSIDPYALAAMLQVTGPVDVAGYGTFSSDDFFKKLNFIVNASTAPGSGKGALTPIGQEVLRHVLAAPASLWPRLLLVFQQQAQSRHIQAYFHDPHLAAAAAQVHLDGQVRGDGQDYLMVSDGNVSLGKEDFYVHKSMQLNTEVNPDGLVRHEVRVHYQMPTAVDAVDTALNPGDGSYRDYVRFYIPQTAIVAGFKSNLDDSQGEGAVDAISFAHGRQVVGAYFRVPRGHEIVLTLTYEVPVQPASSYLMTIQKQAGSPGLPTTTLTSYPGGLSQQHLSLATDSDVRVAW
ncbi:MAG TPA: DUF4012 domain-containing protein [Candidatus Solibacter sp.]|nr:DUF4012 domain-containing protein [Candidatus Solibacter sp.]